MDAVFEQFAGRTPQVMLDPGGRHFAVTVPLLPDNTVLFEVRADTLKRQPGEISLPGGLVEPGERPAEAAVRETCEELLVAPGQVALAGPLDVLLHLSGSLMHPYLVRLADYRFTYSPDEVKAVFAVPLDFFLNNPPAVYHNTVTVTEVDPAFPYDLIGCAGCYPWSKADHPVLFYRYEGRVIWGMTARIIKNLVDILQAERRPKKEARNENVDSEQ